MTYDCAGCAQPIPDRKEGTIWCDTPLGLAALLTCKTQECGRAALAKHPDWKMRKGNQPPKSADEKLKEGLL